MQTFYRQWVKCTNEQMRKRRNEHDGIWMWFTVHMCAVKNISDILYTTLH